MPGTWARSAILIASIVYVLPAAAVEMTAEEAKRFVSGKLFAYTCFEGTSGAGRIYADGSVVGSIQIRGDGPVRYVALPAGTLRVSGPSACLRMSMLAMRTVEGSSSVTVLPSACPSTTAVLVNPATTFSALQV